MNTGFAFGAKPNQTSGFGNYLGATSTSATNPLGTSTLFTAQAAAPSMSLFGATSTPSLFPATSMPTGTGSWLSQPNTASSFAISTAPSLFSGTNTTAATGTTPSTGVLSGLASSMQPTLGLSTGMSSLGLPTSTSAFGGLSTMPSVPSLGFGTGIGTPGFGFGSTATTTPASTTATLAGASGGLGGVDFSQISTYTAGSGTSGKSDSKVLKETVLPDLIKADLDLFRKHVKHQKTVREEISRISSKPIYRVQEETAALKQLLAVASNGLQRNAVTIEKLKAESAQELKNAEISQRTKDLPPSMQYENTAPTKYFHEVVLNFEVLMQAYRKQIEDLEHHLASLAQPTTLLPHELNVIVRRLHETFVALAAQLQLVHEATQALKEDFTHFRRAVLGDSSNIFEANKLAKRKDPFSTTPIAMGPAPFSSLPSMAAVAMVTALNRTQQATGGGSTLGAGTSHLSGLGSTSLMSGSSLTGQSMTLGGFGSSSFKPLGTTFTPSFGAGGNLSLGESSYGVQNATFQLQKPPLGNKRGKRWTSS